MHTTVTISKYPFRCSLLLPEIQLPVTVTSKVGSSGGAEGLQFGTNELQQNPQATPASKGEKCDFKRRRRKLGDLFHRKSFGGKERSGC